MFGLNKANRNALSSIAVLGLIIIILMATSGQETYQARPIDIVPISEKSIFGLDNEEECAPGGKKGSAYTSTKSPGGTCNAQELVAELAGYGISGGIGGSLI